MELIVLTAGRAERLGKFAPHGCKALVQIDHKPMLQHQIDAANPDWVTVVCRTEHRHHLNHNGRVVVDDSARGPAHALHSALRGVMGPVVVAYADTWFTALPEGKDWCGVHPAQGGRYWDVADDEVAYRWVRPDITLPVCVGLYRFDDVDKLRVSLRMALAAKSDEVGMGPVVRRYGARFVDVPSWQDVGDPAALVEFRLPERA